MTARRSDLQFLVHEETTFGTAAPLDQSGKWRSMPFFEIVPEPVLDRVPDDVIPAGSPSAQPSELVDGLERANWRVVVPASQQSVGWWLKMMFGAPTTSGTAPNYIHFFKTTDVPVIPSFTAWEYHSVVNRRFMARGCFANRMTFSASRQGQRARFEFSGQAIIHDKATGTADDSPIVYTSDDAPVELAGDIYLTPEGGAQTQIVDVVTGFNLTCTNELALDEETFNGTNLATQRTASRWAVEGSVNLRFKDFTWTDLGRNGTVCTLEFRLVSGTNNRIILVADGVKFDKFAPQATTAGVITMTAPFRCQKPATGNALVVRLDSQQANYDIIP